MASKVKDFKSLQKNFQVTYYFLIPLESHVEQYFFQELKSPDMEGRDDGAVSQSIHFACGRLGVQIPVMADLSR